jgi:cobalt-zinc-cadmium efflux system protein
MSHDHDHGQNAVGLERLGRAFGVGIALNVAFVGVEATSGVLADSTALLADAAHNLGDVLGLAMAWGATALARRTPSGRHTYGFRRSTILAALANSVLLVAAVGAVAWEAIRRFHQPSAPQSTTMMLVAAVGVVVNAASALLFLRGRSADANVRGAFLHLAADAAVSLGVVVAGAVLWKTGWRWLDPATSLVVSALVLAGTWGLLRDALHLAMDGVPKGIDLDEVRAFLESRPGVIAAHDLHVWAMSTTEVALTAHLVIPWADCPPAFLEGLEEDLGEHFGIVHATVQLEPHVAHVCGRDQAGAL